LIVRRVSFWLVAIVLVLLLFAASAPSPLYGLYQRLWGFSALTLTAIYASYALGGLITLLVAGRLSDFVGRRPILRAGLAVDIAAMGVFILATDVEMLFLGRVLVGIGTGLAIGAVSAWLVDLQPVSDPGLGGIMSSAGTLLGLGAGAMVAALLVQFGPDPLHLVYWLLAATYAVAILGLGRVPDEIPRRSGWQASMRPTIGVPATARRTFVAGAPAVVALWALGGLYLSLGPSLAAAVSQSDSRVAGGLVIFLLCGAGSIAGYSLRAQASAPLLVRGSILLIAGVVTTLCGVVAHSIVLLYGGSLVAGLGLGSAFSAFVRELARLAPPEARAGLLAAVYLLTYASFSVPAIIAGAAVSIYGLVPTAYAYGALVVGLTVVTTVAVSRRSRATPPFRSPRTSANDM